MTVFRTVWQHLRSLDFWLGFLTGFCPRCWVQIVRHHGCGHYCKCHEMWLMGRP